MHSFLILSVFLHGNLTILFLLYYYNIFITLIIHLFNNFDSLNTLFCFQYKIPNRQTTIK